MYYGFVGTCAGVSQANMALDVLIHLEELDDLVDLLIGLVHCSIFWEDSWRLLISITHRFMDLYPVHFTTSRDLVDLLLAWRSLLAYVLPTA